MFNRFLSHSIIVRFKNRIRFPCGFDGFLERNSDPWRERKWKCPLEFRFYFRTQLDSSGIVFVSSVSNGRLIQVLYMFRVHKGGQDYVQRVATLWLLLGNFRVILDFLYISRGNQTELWCPFSSTTSKRVIVKTQDTSIIVAFPLTWAAFIATALIFKFCDPGDEPDKGPVPEDVADLPH